MNAAKFLSACAFALGVITMSAQAAGFRLIEVPAESGRPALLGAMWYPCSEPPGEIDLGPITLPGTKDCPIRGTNLPLVVISHGNLAAYFDHHDTAETLASEGFVVAAINHPGDNFPDFPNATYEQSVPLVMARRPDDIKRLIDFMVRASPAASNIDPKRIGFFGLSAGGYTGLVLVGADPDWAPVLCRSSSAPSICTSILREEFQTRPHLPDLRIGAAVIADPPGPGIWFTADSFAAVKLPVQLWASETGGQRSATYKCHTRECCRRGQKPSGKARVSCGTERRALRLPAVRALDKGCTRILQGSTRL